MLPTPVYTEYRGYSIADYRPCNLACPLLISTPLGALGALNDADAHAKIDRMIAKREADQAAGVPRIAAVLPTQRMEKASTLRNKSERASAQRRRNGRFSA